MSAGLRQFAKYTAVSCAGIGGYLLCMKNDGPVAMPSHRTTSTSSTTWNRNWDRRQPSDTSRRPTATRHLILIRHGQCDYRHQLVDAERVLTPLGRQQAAITAKRLVELNVPIDRWIFSTMRRAQETGNILLDEQEAAVAADTSTAFSSGVPVEHCPLLAEGLPCEPSPYEYWQEDEFKVWQDSARLEAAFRKHFHRAACNEDKDTYTVLVCHNNVIRYFLCRALQLPPEAWLRFNLYHGSVTLLSIRPSGRVTLRKVGEIGHMPPDLITVMNAA